MATVRQQQAARGFVPSQFGGLPAPRPAPTRRTNNVGQGSILSQKVAAVDQMKKEEEKPPAGGILGRGLGMLLNNPVTNTVLRPLDVLDVPRRAVWSTAQELKDAVLPDDGRGGFSPQDWYDQINPFHAITQKGDVTIGAGDVIPDTGNKWLDRGIGLVGDIAGDPLTYVYGLGFVADAGQAAGRGARALNAARAADVAKDAGRYSDDVADALARVTQRGYHAASPEQLADMGVTGGVRFGIPFTGKSTRGYLPNVSKQTSRGREVIRNAADRVGLAPSERKLFDATSPKELEQAYSRLFRGEGPLDARTALETVSTDAARRRGQGMLAGQFGAEVEGLKKEARKLTDDERSNVLEQIETRGVTPTGFAAKVSDIFDRLWGAAKEAGVALERRENYSPHILTRDATQWLRANGDDLSAQRLRGLVTEDLFAPSGVTMHRKFRPGETIELNGQVFQLDNASVNELNDFFKRATGKNFNLYETDPVEVMEKYINMLSADVGTAVAAADRAGYEGGRIALNQLDSQGNPIIGTQVTDEGEQAVSNIGPQTIRPGGRASQGGAGVDADYVPGQNASAVSNPLPEGMEGPVRYGQTDLDVIGQRTGTQLDPELYKVAKDTEATAGVNTQVAGSLRGQRERLQGVRDEQLAGIVETIESLPVEPMARVGRWSSISKKLTQAKNRLIKERDAAVRRDGGWVDQLQGERAARVGTLDQQMARADELEQSIANIEDGVRLYDQTIDDIMRDVEVMNARADTEAPRILRRHVETLTAERDELRAEAQRLIDRQSAIPRPWQDNPELVARREAVSDTVRMEEENLAALEQQFLDRTGAAVQRQEVERLKAARASQTAPPQELKDARDFLETTPDVQKYDDALDTIARQEATGAVVDKPSPQQVGAARRFINTKKGTKAKNFREQPDIFTIQPPAEDLRRYDAAAKTIADYELMKAAPSAAELKEARRFLRTKRGREIADARAMSEVTPSPTQATKTIDGRIRAAEERAAAAEARARAAMDADPGVAAARQRLEEAKRIKPSQEADSLTPNVAPVPDPNVPSPTVRGIPVNQIGDVSGTEIKKQLGIPAGQQGLIPGSDVAREISEASRRQVEDIIDPGEAQQVKGKIARKRDDTKAVIRQDAARAPELVEEINRRSEALATIIKDEDTRNNLLELFREQFKAGPQGADREIAQNAFDNLLSDYMATRAGRGAQQEIEQLRSQIERLRTDFSTVAEVVPPAVGSQEALIARQAEQAGPSNRAVLNLPGGERGRGATGGQRTLGEIDADIETARQRTLDSMDVYGGRQADIEVGRERAAEGLDSANASARVAHDAQREAQTVIEEITDPKVKIEANTHAAALEDIAKVAEDASEAGTANLLRDAVEQVKAAEKTDVSLNNVNQMLQDGRDGKLARVVNIELADQWSIMERQTLGDKYLIHDDLRKAFQNVRDAQYDKDFWPIVDGFTNFFKTYATLTPGFHVRNGMSAAFTNTAGGVDLGNQSEGIRLMNGFLRASKGGTQGDWMAKHGAKVLNEDTGLTVKDAFEAAMGSGIGGRYRERGFADRASVRGKVTEWMFNNKAVNLSKRAGGWVEGGVRLPVALDTMKKGGGVNDAMQRINTLHFDYSQVSRFDEKARKLIPFWTFMSRNLPLQITQMWQKPRVYAWYNSFERNFRGEEQPGTPEYFDAIGAFPFADTKLGGLPAFLQPDLAHTRIDEDFDRYTAALEGNPGQFLSDFNPFFTAPVEWATGKDLYTGAEYDETDVRKTGGLEAPIGWLSQLLGQGEETPAGDFATEERFINAMRAILPVYDRSLRLAPNVTTGGYADDANNRQLESVLRFLGAPVRQLSPQQQRQTLRSEQFDRRDELAMQRALAQADIGGR